MQIYKGNIESLKSPQVSAPRLIELVLEGVIQPLEERQGLDSVLNIIRYLNRDTSAHVPVLLNQQERNDFSKLLDKLPPLRADMSPEEIQEFYTAYDLLPEKLSWQPIVNHVVTPTQALVNDEHGNAQGGDQEPPRHRSQLAQVVYKQYRKDIAGIDCVRHKLVPLEPVALPQRFEERHREILRTFLKANPALPSLHGKMSDDEIAAFLEVYRTIEGRPNWEPRIIDEEARRLDQQEQLQIRRQEEQRLKDQIAAGMIDAFVENSVPVMYFSEDVWIPRTAAMTYLQRRGVFEILEEKYASASGNQWSPNLKGMPFYAQIATVIEDSSRRDEISDYIALALRAVKTDQTNILFRWLQDQTEEGELFLFLRSTNLGIEVHADAKIKGDLFTETHLSKRLSDWRTEARRRLAEISL